MHVVRWIVGLIGIVLVIVLGGRAAGAGLADGGLTDGAFANLVWALVIYLAVDLFLKLRKQ